MRKINLSKYPGAVVGKNVEVFSDNFKSIGNFIIEDDVKIYSKNIELGNNVKIEKGTKIKGIKEDMESFILGDESLIGFDSQILTSFFSMGDYSKLHNNAFVSGYKPIRLGHNCWIGQQSILNCTENLIIGNNVGIGPQSRLWTHVETGELLEGCTLSGQYPLILEDNVLIIGGAAVSPGLILKHNSVVMTGAVLTKSTKAYNTYAGVPAKNITKKLKCWKILSLDAKFNLLKKIVKEFIVKNEQYKDMVFFKEFINPNAHTIKSFKNKEGLLFVKKVNHWNRFNDFKCSVFDLNSKFYTKKRTPIEYSWMKFSVFSYKARFIPLIDY